MTKLASFLLPLVLLLMGAAQPSGHTLTVNVKNLKNDNGLVLLVMFNSADGFPGEPLKGVHMAKADIKNKKAVFTIPNLPAGTYAIAVLHDENTNGTLDTNFLGIPTEGYGASNDARNMFGPPSFKDAKFEVKTSKTIEITIN